MPPRTDLAIFIDCEMTGNSETDEIIEIGCSLIDTATWAEISCYSSLVQPSAEAWDQLVDNATVSAMLTKNGLIGEIEAAAQAGIGLGTAQEVDIDVERWLDAHVRGNTTHIPAGGSGLSHFDRPYLRREFPRFNARLTFWAWDAGDMKRAYRLAGRPWLADAADDIKTHRALDDARMHAREWQYGVDGIRSGFDEDFFARYKVTGKF